MPLDHHALGSIASTIAEATDRLGRLADEAGEDEEAMDLREVERQLQTANRRLAKVVRRLSR